MSKLTACMLSLSIALATGCTQISLMRSSEQTRSLAEQAAAGDAEAQYQLGLRFTAGADSPQSYALGLQHFRQAARQGHTQAQYMLGMGYYTGRGAAIDYAQAQQWLEPAARAGHVEAMHYLGDIYFNGHAGKEEPAWGIRWIGQAAERGLPQAQHLLGISFLTGIGSPKSQPQGVRWLRTAAANGNAAANELLNRLGVSPSGATVAPSTASNATLTARHTTRFIQQRLTELGYRPGPVDGVRGAQTNKALTRFLRDERLDIDQDDADAIIRALRAADHSAAES